MKILFIGNSYTYVNDMPKIFEALCRDNQRDVSVTSVVHGGHKLYQYVDCDDKYRAMLDEAIAADRYDLCFLQEQSFLPLSDYELFFSGVSRLIDKVRPTANAFMLYETWGRKEGHPTLEEFGWTNESMTFDLAAAYKKAGEALNIPVSYVGLNFYKIYTEHPEIELYHEDKTHPSWAGSCLAALTHYHTVFGSLPEDLSSLKLDKNTLSAFCALFN